jgi:hypothetical protein
MPATPMLRAAQSSDEVRRIVAASVPGLRDGNCLLVMVPKDLPPLPKVCTPGELLKRLDALGSTLDLKSLLADWALGKGHLVVIATQDGGESAFLVP